MAQAEETMAETVVASENGVETTAAEAGAPVEATASETTELVTAANEAAKAQDLVTKPVKPPCVCARCRQIPAVLINQRIS